jgi:hypothetical protein
MINVVYNNNFLKTPLFKNMHKNLKGTRQMELIFAFTDLFCYGLDDYGQQGSTLKK